MSLTAGDHLGPYTIVGPLGSGGMGEVYRAHDPRLGRDVALKLLPPAFAQDADRLARFQREAHVLASLSHPNIGAIHGVEDAAGARALVLELVEGPTLADRIAQGPIPLDEALAIARQIGDALEAAHEHGVIHRDLKPANIKLRPDGTVKVLDFGLAKPSESIAATSGVSMSPTITSPAMTLAGIILGTAAYMSPEQAKGRPVDRRADIWAFGCVIYEMLAGQRPFSGDDVSETLAFVLTKEPNWNLLPAAMPAGLRNVLQRCLAKDPKQRIRSAGDVRLALDGAFDISQAPVAIASKPSRGGMWFSLGLVACVLAGLITYALVETAERFAVQRLSIVLPSDAPVFIPMGGGGLAISPNGQHLVYAASARGGRMLYGRPLDQDVARPIEGSEGAARPFFSADGAWIGFFADGRLKKIPSTGGVPTSLADAEAPYGGGSWNEDGLIVFSASMQGRQRLFKVSAEGGTPEAVAGSDVGNHVSPHFLPNGESVLLTVMGDPQFPGARSVVVSLKTGESKAVLDQGGHGWYASTGHLLYLLRGTLTAVPFDVNRFVVTGTPTAFVEGLVPSSIAMSANGVLAHVSGAAIAPRRALVWVDIHGQFTPASKEPGGYAYPRISPDGQRVAVGIDSDIWVLDTVRGTRIALTSGDRTQASVSSPMTAWTADGNSITFSSALKAGEFALELIRADGSGRRETLHMGDDLLQPGSWSRDGRVLAFYRRPQKSASRDDRDLWLLQIGAEVEAKPFLATRFRERAPYLSPDRQSIVYVSDASGRDEVYMRPLGGPVSQTIVSNEGGTEPVWARDGKTIFYRNGRRLMSVSVVAHTGSGISLGEPRLVLEGNYLLDSSTARAVPNYDVSSDGTRFLMISDVDTAGGLERLSVVLNFFEELKQRAPAR